MHCVMLGEMGIPSFFLWRVEIWRRYLMLEQEGVNSTQEPDGKRH